MQDPTPTTIAAAFTAVGREAPPLEACAELAMALDNGADLDRLCAHVAAQFGSDFALRRYAPQYRAALNEAAEPAAWIARLEIEIAERERWAADADKEAGYRLTASVMWTARGDAESAQRYADQAESERRFARHCREDAEARRVKAAELGPQAQKAA